MARKITGDAAAETKPTRKTGAICQDCGKNLSDQPYKWAVNMVPYHCTGSRWAFGSQFDRDGHHCPEPKHLPCWKCRADMGCLQCSGIVQELLCENIAEHDGMGAVWATKQAFIEHGPMIQQPSKNKARAQTVEDYPAQWRRDYSPEVKDAHSLTRMEDGR